MALVGKIQHLQGAEADGYDPSQLFGAHKDSTSFVLHPWQDYQHNHVPNPSRWSSSTRPSGKGRGYYVDEDNNDYDDDDRLH